MTTLEGALAGAIIASLAFYALLAGADFGGGIWDLLARGPRAKEQRTLIAGAIGPIWEANHVWLILLIVILFTGFPAAFAAIATALHVPLTLMLIGVVLRGAAFTIRTYGRRTDDAQRRWGMLFAIASAATPLTLGVSLGAVASGRITVEGGVVTCGFWSPWLAPFPFAVGALVTATFALLAATYLAVEAKDRGLREDFRRRALGAAVLVGATAFAALWCASDGAPRLAGRMTWRPFQTATGCAAAATIAALWFRRYATARACAALQVLLMIGGFGVAQFPYLVPPSLTLHDAAAPPETLRLLVGALVAGSILLFPSFYFLFRVFKGRRAFAVSEADTSKR